MRIRRRSLRKGLVIVGCAVGSVGYPQAAIGGGLIALGAGLHFWSKGCLEQNRRLTTAGPYRWTRNPFYLANLLIDLGLCLVIGKLWLTALFVTIWGLSYRETIKLEEQRLAGLFPAEYPAYRSAVPRLFPNGRPLDRALVNGRFSLANPALAKGAEYARLLGIAIAPAAIVAAETVRREGFALFDGDHAGQLAFLLLLPALWIVKLALAETFRRPQTALVPWLRSSRLQRVLVVVLGTLSLGLATRLAWLAVLSGLWCALLILDLVAARRWDGSPGDRRAGWSYTPAIAAGSIVTVACVAVLSH